MTRREGWEPHVLHVTVDRCPACPPGDGLCPDCAEEPELNYTIECPGAAGDCDAWFDCPACYVSGVPLATETRDRLENCGEAHGETHMWCDGRWMTRQEPRQCFVAGHDSISEEGSYVANGKPGRYLVEFDADGTDLVLHLVANPAAVLGD